MSSELPEGWHSSTVRDLFSCWGGMTPSTGTPAYWGGKVPWISSKDVKTWKLDAGTEYITERALSETRLRKCRPGTVLVVVRSGVLAHTLPVALTTEGVVVNQDLKALDSGDDHLNEWLAYYLRAHEREILEANRKDGTTVQSIRVEELLDRDLPIPPLPEQRRIVAKTEALLEQANRAKGRLANAPFILKRLRQAVLAAACSGRLTEEWRGSEAASARGLPSGWRRVPLRAVASQEPRSIQSGPFGSNLLHSEFTNSGKLVLGIDNVGDGHFSLGKQHRISPAKFKALEKYAARPLDVLVTVMATVGRCCIVPADLEPAIISKHVYRITTDQEQMLPEFLQHVLRGAPEVMEQVRDQIRGQTRPGINGEILKALELPLPPLEEQRVIVARTGQLLATADAIERLVQAAWVHATRLPQSILSKAFSGELVRTEAELARAEGREYESASALLARLAKSSASAEATSRRRQLSRQIVAAEE